MAYTDPPLIPMYASFIISIFGEGETMLHLGFLVFPIIAAFSLFYIAKRLVPNPIFAALIALATPTFIVNSHSIMQDVPLMALFLMALALYIKGVDENKDAFLLLGALAAVLAFLAKYNGLLVLPLMLGYSIISHKPKTARYLGLTLLVILGFFAHNLYYYGEIHLFSSLSSWVAGSKGFSQGLFSWAQTTLVLLAANLNYIGGATIFFPFLIWPFAKKRMGALFMLGSFSLTLSVLLYIASKNFVSGQYSMLQLSLFFVFVTSALFAIWIFFFDNRKLILKSFKMLFRMDFGKLSSGQKNTVFLLAWLAMIFIFNFTIAGGSARYNTLLLPPLAMLFVLHLGRYRTAKYLSAALISTLAVGYAVAFADYQYAETYRQIPTKLPFEADVYFLGHEGFKYYMEKNGAIFMNSYGGNVNARDLIVKAPLSSPVVSDEIRNKLKNPEIIEFNTIFPVRVLNSDAHAGFYKYGAGFLPFSLSLSPLEKFEVYTVDEGFKNEIIGNNS